MINNTKFVIAFVILLQFGIAKENFKKQNSRNTFTAEGGARNINHAQQTRTNRSQYKLGTL